MLKTRIWTALALLLLCLPILWMPNEKGVRALGLVLITLGSWEWARLNLNSKWPKLPIICALLTFDVGIFFISNDLLNAPPVWSWMLLGVIWVLMSWMVFKGGVGAWLALPAWFRWLTGWVVLMATWIALCLAKRQGIEFLMSCLALVWCADIGAYFVGRALGRRKLAPVLSPGKSWEGAIGGGVLVILMALIWIELHATYSDAQPQGGGSLFAQLWLQGPVVFFLSLTVLVALCVVGDLFESLMKRAQGVKDSSQLLPGHGGVLDRLDAVIACLPWCVFLTLYFR
jgi:phosphatidate cytidylyltransferase